METKFTKEEYEALLKQAEEIIKGATRDIVLWTEIKDVVERKIKDL